MPQANRTALISLTDKTGLPDLARALVKAGYRIVASTGTANAIRDLSLPCDDVEAVTGSPELLGGRVKTLHPVVFGGILARVSSADDLAELERAGIGPVSVVAVNLYRFGDTATRPGATQSQVLEQIDIGGVALLRAAAKNFEHVSVLAEPGLYPEFIAALERGGPSLEERRRLAARAFALVAEYDDAIASWFAGERVGLPDVLSLNLPLRSRLRYGENPWAKAAFYHGEEGAFPQALAGKTLSYNNMLDVDSCLRLLAPIARPDGFPDTAEPQSPVLAAIVKHTVPCGLAAGSSAHAALEAALGADPISAFGGIVAVNARLDMASAQLLKPRFLEVVAAPAYDDGAIDMLRTKKHLRLLRFDSRLPAQLRAGMTVRSALGGVLAERPDESAPADRWQVVTERQPSPAAWRDLLFAFGAVRQVKSNAAVVVKGQVTLGVCGGQTNRVAAVELACRRAGDAVRGAVLATDGFFPFADGIEAAIAAGVAAVVAPSGSIRDGEVIEAARRGGIALLFASRRYFLH
ncbi:MAG: bifunctional phosphoribosylaminoimidazolecarboxamide formyltransferase/IMP cyclohydrolase [Candidatus Eremiobacteraeota bacterium]|nr:bifunctional phosphoribosylaminoimidazolecarboxamide formyltransferase/IMP cyclohydrolase [Candidatus Eremiobacteraeota bacterium]